MGIGAPIGPGIGGGGAGPPGGKGGGPCGCNAAADIPAASSNAGIIDGTSSAFKDTAILPLIGGGGGGTGGSVSFL